MHVVKLLGILRARQSLQTFSINVVGTTYFGEQMFQLSDALAFTTLIARSPYADISRFNVPSNMLLTLFAVFRRRPLLLS